MDAIRLNPVVLRANNRNSLTKHLGLGSFTSRHNGAGGGDESSLPHLCAVSHSLARHTLDALPTHQLLHVCTIEAPALPMLAVLSGPEEPTIIDGSSTIAVARLFS